MAARAPRRTFARPFVLTLATLPACTTATTSAPPAHELPVTRTQPIEPVPAPAPHKRWKIERDGAECLAVDQADPCPDKDPNMSCNPPPPVRYKCVDGAGTGAPIIVQAVQGGDCQLLANPCPADDPSCTRAPARKVDCPED